jgi:hypothetical protein
MRLENFIMLVMAFVINIFVVCVFAEVGATRRERGVASATPKHLCSLRPLPSRSFTAAGLL